MADHKWQDDALRPGGRAWIAGVAFTCACALERRANFEEGFHVMKGHASEKKSWIHFKNGKRVKGGVPECNTTRS